MNRVDRLMAVLTTLQSHKYVTVRYIAEKYEISERTVFRDLKALGEIGVPISFESGRGYCILPGFFLPPVYLTSEEANAIILVCALSERFSDKATRKHVENGLDKIKAVLRSSDKDKADLLQSRIRVYNSSEATENTGFLTDIQNAIIDKQVLAIEYTNNAGEESQREIEPIGLTFYSAQWHLIAWCWKRNAYRDFKVNQINNLLNKREPFKKTDHYDINKYILSIS